MIVNVVSFCCSKNGSMDNNQFSLLGGKWFAALLRLSLLILQYNSPGLNPSILRHHRHRGAADEAVLNRAHKNW